MKCYIINVETEIMAFEIHNIHKTIQIIARQ